MLNVIHTRGDDTLARVYVAELADGTKIEFVESVQPPIPREEKWVLIVSTLKGCPVKCPICDAGGDYHGKLSAEEIVAQVEHMVRLRYPDGHVPVPKFKVQFARMGDPAFNDAVIDALEILPERLHVPGFLPSISTVAPVGRGRFFDRLIEVKDRLYSGGRFQMQFSVHTTCDEARRQLVPIRTLSLKEMAEVGCRFYRDSDRKVTLNFAPAEGLPLEPRRLAEVCSPEKFAVKLTPINPTFASAEAGLVGSIDPRQPERCQAIVAGFEAAGFQTILSIGELEENAIGSNCGMFVHAMEQLEASVDHQNSSYLVQSRSPRSQ